MAYQSQTLSIAVDKGLDATVAPELTPAGNLLELSNCQYARLGKIEQRPGFELMSNVIGYGSELVSNSTPLMAGVAFGAPVFIGKSGATNKPLLQHMGATINRWQEPQHTQAVAPIRTRRRTIAGDVNSVTDPDIASYGDYRVITYYDLSKTCIRVLLTTADGVTLQVFTIAGTRARVVSFSTYFLVFYATAFGGNLNVVKLIPGSALSAASTVGAGAALVSFDVKVRGTEVDVICCNAAATSFYSSWNPATMTSSRSGTIAVDSSNAVSFLDDSAGTGNLMVGACGGVNGLRVHKLSSSGAVSITTSWTVDATLVLCRNVTGYTYGLAANNEFRLAVEQSAGWVVDDAPQTLFVKRNSAGTITTTIWLRQCAPVSRVFYRNGQYFFVAGLAPDSLQNTNYVMAMPPEAVPNTYAGAPYPRAPQAVMNRLCGTSQTSAGQLASVVAGGSDFVTVLPRSIRIATEDNGYLGYTLVTTADLHDLVFDDTAQFQQPAPYDRGLLVPNGITRHWDGSTYGELGFAFYPPGIDSSTASSGGSMEAGTYNYVATYRYTDRQGRLYRSAPMPTPYSKTVTASQKLDVKVKSLHLTGHYCPNNPADVATYNVAPSSVYVELWREDSSGIYRIAGSAMNDLSSDTTTVRDQISAATLAENEPLTNGGSLASGLLANDNPPGFCGGCWHQSRFVGINGESPTELWFSKPLENGLGLAFSEALVYRIPEAGEILALASFSDRLFVIGTNGVFICVGEPANNLGAGGSFQHTQLSFKPATSPKIAVTDLGIFYVGQNEGTDSPAIHLTGAETRELKAPHEIVISVYDVAYCPERNQVWFMGRGGDFGALATAAVYDVTQGLWSRFAWGTAAADAPGQALANWAGKMFLLGLFMNPWVQSAPANGGGDAISTSILTPSKDPNGNIIMSIGLPWLCLGGGRGNRFQLHEVRFVGESSTHFRFKIEDRYDFVDTTTQTAYLTDPTNPMDVKHKPNTRKQVAWRCVLSTDYPAGNSYSGFRLTEVQIDFTPLGKFRNKGSQVAT